MQTLDATYMRDIACVGNPRAAAVKLRPDDTTSERQLVLALAATGRKVALGDLASWRHDGLLPPLASTGVHAGRSYYWAEPDIQDQARIVHDALRRHGRVDATIITLWLNGFAVPLPRLRRAWLHSRKLRKAPVIRRAMVPAAQGRAANLSQLLQQAALGAAAAMTLEDKSQPGLGLLEQAALRLGLGQSSAGQLRQAWHMAQVAVSMLRASDLLRQASDDEMHRAQRALRSALDHVWHSSDGESRAVVVEALGETLFLYILTLLRSGQEAVLEAMLAHIEAHRSRPAARPQPVYAQA